MKEGYTIKDQAKTHFITATIVDWVDIFSRKDYRDCIIESLSYCVKNKGMIIYGYVIMTNHVHLIIQSEHAELSDLLRDFKKFTATRILDLIKNIPESRREWMLERFHKATLIAIIHEFYKKNLFLAINPDLVALIFGQQKC